MEELPLDVRVASRVCGDGCTVIFASLVPLFLSWRACLKRATGSGCSNEFTDVQSVRQEVRGQCRSRGFAGTILYHLYRRFRVSAGLIVESLCIASTCGPRHDQARAWLG